MSTTDPLAFLTSEANTLAASAKVGALVDAHALGGLLNGLETVRKMHGDEHVSPEVLRLAEALAPLVEFEERVDVHGRSRATRWADRAPQEVLTRPREHYEAAVVVRALAKAAEKEVGPRGPRVHGL